MPAVASPEAQADAHACLLEALKTERVAVIGGSAGTPSAMQVCLRHPERCSALVLLFPMAFAPGRAQVKPFPLFLLVVKTTLHSDFPFWAATNVTRGSLMKTILGTPVVDFQTAPAEEQERELQVMQHILPVSQRERFGAYTGEMFGREPHTTNNRMELQAVIEGLEALKEPCSVSISTDSQYEQRGITEWLAGWKANGWRKRRSSKGSRAVLNQDLWEQLDKQLACHSVNWKWVKGHADDVDNLRCDSLANRAAREQISSEGVIRK